MSARAKTPRARIQGTSLQMAQLLYLMQQVDAEWEELTRSLQADKRRLDVVQQHLENYRLLLALEREQPSRPAAFTVQMAALEQEAAGLEQRLALVNVRRSAAIRQFERSRLDLAALRRPPEKQHANPTLARKLLATCIKRPLHWVWWVTHQTKEQCEIIPGDVPFRRFS